MGRPMVGPPSLARLPAGMVIPLVPGFRPRAALRFEVYWFSIMVFASPFLLHANHSAPHPAAFTFSPPPVTIQPKYETSDVKMPSKRSHAFKHPEGSQPNSIFDGVLTFTAINQAWRWCLSIRFLRHSGELAKANKEPVFSNPF